MSHVFISYSRKDLDLAERLEKLLTTARFDVWIDKDKIQAGQRWENRIIDAIESCAAFVLVESPNAEKSKWVMREFLHADEHNKPIFPILVEGENWPILEKIQYEDMRGQSTMRLSSSLLDELRRSVSEVARIFISYSDDARGLAVKLTEQLRLLSADVWIDFDRIKENDDHVQQTCEGLESSRILLLLVSPKSMNSSKVEEHWKHFCDNNKIVIPILCDSAPVPVQIFDKQYIDFLDQSYEAAFAQLYGFLLRECDVRLSPLKDNQESLELPPKQPFLTLRWSDMIDMAVDKLWISGVALNKLIKNEEKLLSALTRGVNIRCLLVALDIPFLNELGAWLGKKESETLSEVRDQEEYKFWEDMQNDRWELTDEGRYVAQRVWYVHKRLSKMAERAPQGAQFEVREMYSRPSLGYFMVDPDSEHGMLTALQYFFQVDNDKFCSNSAYGQPTLQYITKRSANENSLRLFRRYQKEFDLLWENAKCVLKLP